MRRQSYASAKRRDARPIDARRSRSSNRSDAVRLARRHERHEPAVARQGGIPFDGACDQRLPAGHRLEQHDPETFAAERRGAHDVCGLVVRRQRRVRHPTDKVHRHRSVPCCALERGAIRSIADDDQVCARYSGANQDHCAKKMLNALSRFEATHRQDHGARRR